MNRYFLIALFLIGTTAHAERDWHIGWLGGVTNYSIDDPFGPTQSKSKFLWKDVVGLYDLSRDRRVFGMLSDNSYTVDASPTEIGQDAARKAGLLAYQFNFRLSREFKPWVGLGVGYASESYKPRYTVTSTGFLKAHFPDRDVDGAFVLANASAQWPFAGGTAAGIHLQYEHGFSGLSDQITAAFFISY